MDRVEEIKAAIDRLSPEERGGLAEWFRARERRYDLDELVSRITPENRHPETEWGKLGSDS
jgi:antitoxin component of MazEF toxin-antitoxin module